MKNKVEEFYLFVVNHKEKIFMIVEPPIYNGSYYDNMVKTMSNVNASSVSMQNFKEAISDWESRGYKHVTKEFFLERSS